MPDTSSIIAAALAEDLGVEPGALLAGPVGPELLARDVTTAAVIGADARFVGVIRAREDCVVCGLPVAARVFETLADAAGLFEAVDVFPLVAEGARVTRALPSRKSKGSPPSSWPPSGPHSTS